MAITGTHINVFQGFFEGLKMAQVGYNWKGTVAPVLIEQKKRLDFLPGISVSKFCSLHRVVAECNLIHVKEFGCLACDQNLASVFSVAIPFYVRTTASVSVL